MNSREVAKMNIYPLETVAYFTSGKETAPEWTKAEKVNYLENEGARYEELTGVRKILANLFR
jgi:hypothetical protein